MEEERYQNKYRVPSIRLNGWDYGSHGLYFVTACTKDRVPYFGQIENNSVETQGSETQSSETQSSETQSIASLQVPDNFDTETQGIASLRMTDIGKIAFDNWLKIPDYHPYVELDEFVLMPDHFHGIIFINKPDKINWETNKFGAQSKNLASIIRGYKSSVKQYASVNNLSFEWQSRYYDRVIRDEKEYENVREYIYDNPVNWFLNKDNFENLFIA